MRAGREKEESDLVPHVDDSVPVEPGRWTAKDNLAHLSAWRLTATAELDAIRTGNQAASSVSDDIEQSNAKVYEATRQQPDAQVLDEARSSWATLTAAVEACTEEASIWSHDLASNTMPDARQRATADYNLGCFYAVRGRVNEAIPYLRSGIEQNPSLREWARTDTDLDPIRSAPELVRLLA